MATTTKQQSNIVAIITMMFLYAMISFVTNLAAPIGTIWKGAFEGGSNVLGMLGNLMNFLAYLVMGIPAGKLLIKIGYKKTALLALLLGLVGVFVQFLSGTIDAKITAFVIYLIGAFISGLCVCVLNTVVNPMMNLLGGGGNRGNQLNMIGGTLNSLAGTLTPLFVGALIGQIVTSSDIANGLAPVGSHISTLSDVNPVLYIAMAVFAVAFVVIMFIPIHDPDQAKVTADTKFEHSPWSFRHFVLGAIGIFFYVGIEVGIPGTLNFYLADQTAAGAGIPGKAVAIAGAVVAIYWLLMLVGRTVGSFIAAKVSSKAMLSCTTAVASILIIIAMVLGKSVTVSMPTFTGSSFAMAQVPVAALLFVLCGLCTSVMWASIFNLATEGLGKYTSAASGIFMMMVVGGGILPLIQSGVADAAGYLISYIVPLIGLLYLCFYAVKGSKNVNTDIKVD